MFSFLLFTALYSLKPVVLDELALAYDSDTSQTLKVILQTDVFDRLDKDHDGVLSAEEWRLFLEGSAENFYGGVTSEMVKIIETYPYPVLEVTDDMTPDQVQAVCNLGNQLKDLDLVKEMERYANDAHLLLKDASDDIRQTPAQELNLVQFQYFLEKASLMRLSKQLVIPEECKQLAGTGRRRTFSFLGSLILPIAIIGAINGCNPLTQNGWNHPGCKLPDSDYNRRYPCKCAWGIDCPCLTSSSNGHRNTGNYVPGVSVRPDIIKRRERRRARM